MLIQSIFRKFHVVRGEKFAPNIVGRLCLLLGLICASFCFPVAARAQSNVHMTAQVGFDGFYRPKTWAPVRVTLSNDGPDMTGVLQAAQFVYASSNNRAVFAQEISLPAGARKTATLNVYLESPVKLFRVSLMVGDQEVTYVDVQSPGTLEEDEQLYGVMADTLTPFNLLGNLGASQGHVYVAQVLPADLPDQSLAWDALDVLVVAGGDTGVWSQAQREALASWIGDGGHLVVGGGGSWQKTTAGLSEVLPVRLRGTTAQASLAPLSSLAHSPQEIGTGVVAQATLQPGARLLAGSEAQPLVVSWSKGAGRVTYLAFDPSAAPFAGWEGQAEMYQSLLFGETGRPGWARQGFQNSEAAINAASSIPGQGMPSAGLVIGFMVVYVVAVGPVNYLVLRTMKRREWAWWTIPALVGVFCLIAFIAGGFIYGVRPVLNRLALVQISAGAPQASVSGLVGIFSPYRASYELQTGSGVLAHPVITNNDSDQSAEDWLFTSKPAGGVVDREVRVDAGGVRPLMVNARVPGADIHGKLTVEINSNGTSAAFNGEVVNASKITLQHAALLYPGGTQDLGALAPGAQVSVHGILSTSSPSKNYPILPGQTSSSSSAYYTYARSSDDWFDALVGTTGLPISDPDQLRRYSLLTAISASGAMEKLGAPGKVYLAGWSDAPVLDAALTTPGMSTIDTSLYLVELDSQYQVNSAQKMEIGSGLYSWRVLEASSGIDPTRERMTLSQGRFSLAYRPPSDFSYHSPTRLTIRLKASGSQPFPSELGVLLWNFERHTWDAQPVNTWGNYTLDEPAAYVDWNGEVWVRLDCSSSIGSKYIQMAEMSVSLEIQP